MVRGGAVAVATLLASALGVLAACGGDSVALDPVAEAATNTAEQGSARIALTIEGDQLEGRGSGVSETQPGGAGRMEMTLTGQGGSADFDVIGKGLTIYMRSPVFELPEGKWLKIDLEEAAEREGIDLESLMALNQNPTDLLAYLKASSGKVEKIGRETVRGVSTTHYRATVDLERVGEEADDDTRESLRQLERLMGETTIPVEVWIDKDRLVRRHAIETRFARGQPTVRLTTEFYDFGVEVDVDEPDESDVVDAFELMEQGSGG